jgi:hypothetical protein
MNEHYEIRVGGLFGPVLRVVLADLPSRTRGPQSVIHGRLTDDDLERLLTRLDRCGLEVLRLNRIGG